MSAGPLGLPPCCDVLIAGGGPAGAAAAWRLSAAGRAVVLVDAGRRPGTDRVETLPPAVGLLDGTLPLHGALAQAWASPLVHLAWQGPDLTVVARPGTLAVRRSAFDRALLAAVSAGGCTVVSPARVLRPAPTARGWSVAVRSAAGLQAIEARCFIDATGRAGATGLRAEPLGPATVALCQRWLGAGARPGEVLIEALPDAWGWALGDRDGALETALFVDRHRCARLGRVALAQWFLERLRASRHLGAAIRGAVPAALRVCDATPMLRSARDGAARLLHAGDAAFAADPLSSQGVQCALRSGVQAAAVANTLLGAGDAAAALAFHDAALQRLSTAHRSAAAAWYGESAAGRAAAFWDARSASPPAPEPAPVPSALAPDTWLRLSPTAVMASHPALCGDRIERVPAVAAVAGAEPLSWAGEHPLPVLLRALSPARRVRDLLGTWAALMPLAQARQLLASLVARGIIVADGRSVGRA